MAVSGIAWPQRLNAISISAQRAAPVLSESASKVMFEFLCARESSVSN